MTDDSPDKQQDVVAIDGPSGSGKSTVARALADRLGYQYLDTGAMYRAVTWHFLSHEVDVHADPASLQSVLDGLTLRLPRAGLVELNGHDVSSHLRSRDVEKRVSAVSAVPVVSKSMRRLQRAIADAGPVVAEGRDMASVVYPRARWKFYLDAQPSERARLTEVRQCACECLVKEILPIGSERQAATHRGKEETIQSVQPRQSMRGMAVAQLLEVPTHAMRCPVRGCASPGLPSLCRRRRRAPSGHSSRRYLIEMIHLRWVFDNFEHISLCSHAFRIHLLESLGNT